MDLHTFTSVPHLHADARRQTYLAEADRDSQLRLVARERPAHAGVRHQLGAALIRAGELLRGPVAPVVKPA
jgi:hypothetical protein